MEKCHILLLCSLAHHRMYICHWKMVPKHCISHLHIGSYGFIWNIHSFSWDGLQTTRLLVPNSGPNSSHLAEPPRLLLEAHGFLFIRQRHNWPRGGVVHNLFEVVFNSYGRSIWRCTYIYIYIYYTYQIYFIYIYIKYVIIIFFTVYHICFYIYIYIYISYKTL